MERGDVDKREKLRQKLDRMSPEQRAALAQKLADRVMRQTPVKVGSKTTNLKALRDRVMRMKEDFEHGVYDESIRTVPRWAMQELTPSTQLRPGAYKQILRKEEEAELELDRFGDGVVYSSSSNALDRAIQQFNALHKRDFSWGVFARAEQAERALRRRWALKEPEEALADPDFYFDIIRNCHRMELTLMVLTTRPLPLAPLRQALSEQLEQGVGELAVSEEQGQEGRAALQRFIRLWDDERLSSASWVDAKKGVVKEGTHFILSAAPTGTLTVEAISPGPLRDRKTSLVGTNSNHAVTGALFGLFLGHRAVDPLGRTCVGNGFLWAANGGRFRLGQGQPHIQHLAGDCNGYTEPQVEAVEVRPSIFRLLGNQAERARRMLLSGIQSAQQLEAEPL